MPLIYRSLREKPTVDKDRRLEGYIAKFNVESIVIRDPEVCDGPFVEVIQPGAFDRSLRDNDIRALVNHDATKVIGRTSSGTLELKVDDVGLYFRVALPDTTAGRDAAVEVARRDVDGCSFGFDLIRSTLEDRPGKPPLHTLIDIDVYEVSPVVTWPSYTQTDVSLRALRDQSETSRERRRRALVARLRWLRREL